MTSTATTMFRVLCEPTEVFQDYPTNQEKVVQQEGQSLVKTSFMYFIILNYEGKGIGVKIKN